VGFVNIVINLQVPQKVGNFWGEFRNYRL